MKNGHGGRREGSGRKKGTGVKTERVFGYKYTPEEAIFINEVLNTVKKEHKTTSKSIIEIFKFYKDNKK